MPKRQAYPSALVTGDSVYGHDARMRSWWEERRISYVLGVTAQYRIFTGEARQWAATVVGRLPEKKWRRRSCGAGSLGERIYDWALMPLCEIDGGRRRWLLARRSISDRAEIARLTWHQGCVRLR